VRLKNKVTGAVVDVPEDKAARLGGQWEPAEAPPAAEPKKPARRKAAEPAPDDG
jgi:hypothetical protein